MTRKIVSILIMALALVWLITHGEASALQKPAEFSGDLVITEPNSTIKAKLYIKGLHIRRVEMAKEAGGMIFIRPPEARGKIWMLDPVKKQYSILSWPQKHKDPVFVEDARRILIGVGWVKHVGDFVEYKYKEKSRKRDRLIIRFYQWFSFLYVKNKTRYQCIINLFYRISECNIYDIG